MGLKELFLKLPLKVQIHIGLLIIILICFHIILITSLTLVSILIKYLILTKKKYFYDIELKIIESDVLFQSLCLLQYENLIKLFNYQLYLYIYDESMIVYFATNGIYNYNESKLVLLTPEVDKISPEYDRTIPDENKKIYIYCYLDNSTMCQTIYRILYTNSISFFYQIQGVNNFRIPFYGDFPILGEYILAFTKYGALFSLNITRIREMINLYDGDINNKLIEINIEKFNYYKKYFSFFENKQLNFFDIIYRFRYNIFSDYIKIHNETDKEDYIKQQSIYFQSVDFESGTTQFFNSWDYLKSRFTGKNNVINGYIDFIIILLSTKINLITIPISHDTNNIISKNLCYYFLLKQMININININSEINIKEFNQKDFDEIYNIITNKDVLTIEDCRLSNYYPNHVNNYSNNEYNFSNYYDLEYQVNLLLYSLIKNNEYLNILELKNTYPDYTILKDYSPYFFSFQQLDLFSYYFTNFLAKVIQKTNENYYNIRFLMILIIFYLWIIIFIVVIIITKHIIKEIIEPIIKLTNAVNLCSKSENIDISFEYKLDDNINKLFLLCKDLIKGKNKDHENILKKNNSHENYLNNNIRKNNNLIIDNQMILDLIDIQKSSSNNLYNKEIILFNMPNMYDTKNDNKKKKINKGIKEVNSLRLNKFSLKKVCSYDANSKLDSNKDEDELSNNNNNTNLNNIQNYQNLLAIIDFTFNNFDENKNKLNEYNDSSKNSSINKKYKKLVSQTKISVNNKDMIDFMNIRNDCNNDITYYWYMEAKRNKSIGNYDKI